MAGTVACGGSWRLLLRLHPGVNASASASAILLNSTLVEHDAGSGWSIVPSPTPSGSTQVYLPGLTCASASGCWAVGYSSGGALIEQGRTA